MITPLDIDNKRFSKQMVNGYSVEEVDDFLDELTADYSKNYKEVNELKAKVEELNNSFHPVASKIYAQAAPDMPEQPQAEEATTTN